MALYLKWFSFASVIKNLDYSNKHTSKLRNEVEVNRRIDALKFWEEFGIKAAIAHAKASRSTLYNWRKALGDSRKLDRMGRASLSALDPKSTRPIRCRSAHWDKYVLDFIKDHKSEYANEGRRAVYESLRRHLTKINQLDKLVSESTVGRMLKWLKYMGRIREQARLSLNAKTGKLHQVVKRKIKRLRRANLPFKVKHPGDLVQIDGIEGHSYGKHYYVINAIDYVSRRVVSEVFRNKTTANTAKFLAELPERMGFSIKAIQTDNGSEYLAKFHERAEAMGIAHCFNYVKKPIYNGMVERFNRTLKEALFNDEVFFESLSSDLDYANQRISQYLNYYNNERSHTSLNYQTPTEFLVQYFQRDSVQYVLN